MCCTISVAAALLLSSSLALAQVNDPPVGGADAFSLLEGQSVTITVAEVLANDTDADGPQSLSMVGLTQPAHGRLTINPFALTLTYTPDDDFSGTDSFTYWLSDGMDQVPVEVLLTVVNVDDDPPRIAGCTFCPGQDLGWDTGTVSVPAPGLLREGTYDPEGQPLTLELVQAPVQGTVTLHADGSFTYGPNPVHSGADTFDYRVSDGVNTSLVAQVTLLRYCPEESTQAVAVSTTTTVDQDTPAEVFLRVIAPGSEFNALAFELVTPPAHGQLGEINTNTLMASYTPDTGFVGEDYLRFAVLTHRRNPDTQSIDILRSEAPIRIVVRQVIVPAPVGPISAPMQPVAVGTLIAASASFTDSRGPQTANWMWGDGSIGGGLVDMDTEQVIGTHVYLVPGVYTLVLSVTDQAGRQFQQTYQYVVVFDPSAGYVAGHGSINSPPGAFHPDVAEFADFTGKATFGFVAKYQKGADLPTGTTAFQFKAGDLRFESTAFQWLVISGARAQFKGNGTVNNLVGFEFLLTAIDGDLLGRTQPDRFRIKIWHTETGVLIYDNQQGIADTADLTTDGALVQTGNVVIHK